MARFDLDLYHAEQLQEALLKYQRRAVTVINDVLHNEGGQLAEESIRRLIPVSGKQWKGKRTAAKKANNSLAIEPGKLSVTVKTTKNYHYLWFPDDGTNTYKHIGYKGVPREFFRRGGEAVQNEIIDRCINKLTETFESEV